MRRSIVFILLAFSILYLEPVNAAPKKDSGVQFSYKALLDKSFKFEVGRVIPLTFEQSVETDGDISADGNYFYYSSNRENGNYDIYIRNLKDITTVRLTDHPSKDISPAISPDGKRLAFISYREDPEGDIYVMKINPEKIISSAQESISETPSFDEKAKNITQFQEPVTNTIKIIKDASPSWSPDGEWIAFSSTRDGMENIWMIRKNGKDLEKVTSKGGIYPRFSPDGKEIIFISYRDKDSNGDVYIINIATKGEKRITNTSAIELYPAFLGNNNEIVYTIIDRDTNKDGRIDLKDNSVLYYKNLSANLEYPITTYSQSSFNPRWISVFGGENYKGILVYSEQTGHNINVNILPETGIIPKSPNPALQYELAYRFFTEFDDREKHIMGLERVYHFFRGNSDNESTVFVTKGLVAAALKFSEENDVSNANRILSILKELSKKGNIYTVAGYNFLTSAMERKNSAQVLKDALDRARSDKKNDFYIPYIMEDIADNYVYLKDFTSAIQTYRSIINDFGKYKRIISIHNNLARLSETALNEKIGESILAVMTSGTVYQQFQMKLHFLSMADSEKDLNRRLDILGKMAKAYDKNRTVIGLIYYSIAKANFERNNLEEAKKYFQLAAKNVAIVDIVFYRSNNYMGDIEIKNNKIEEAEAFFNLAVNRYIQMWKEKDIIERIKWLINFYETYGERAEFSGNYTKAAALYKKYYQLMSFLNLRRFTELYNEYGSRAHVLYIDAFTELKENKNVDELETEYTGDLDRKKMDFDKAYIYGLGYVYAKKAILEESSQNMLSIVKKPGMGSVLKNFKESVAQIDWALFLDDTFIDPYILKSWIYQYLDLKRNDETIDSSAINEYFPEYLWEKNITLLEKTLSVNDEAKHSENEGNIHLNIANNFFLLTNYPRALSHYKEALKYKKEFGSKIEEALFYFHMGYSFWQNNDIKSARNEINKALIIYESLASGKNLEKFKNQIYTLYRYFALFYRMEENYKEAIKWYQKLIDFTAANKMKIDRAKARYLQEIAFCYKELGDVDAAISYLDKSKSQLTDITDDVQKYKLRFRVMGLFSFSFLDLGQDAAVIGDSKIYKRLDKKNNELLNIALHEEIYSDSGDYLKAIEYLEKKAGLLKGKKSSIDKITMITTLNNQGYYYFRAGKYKEAKEKFHQAWAFSSDKDTNDLQGIFTSLINISNLYAYLIENNIRLIENPQKDLLTLIDAAAKYRETYKSEKYRIELENLEKKAKEKKEKVDEKDKEELKKQIDEKAREIHFKIDISLGLLNYYMILIDKDNISSSEKKSAKGPLEIYKNEKKIYDLYSDILKKFEGGLENARRLNNKKLEIKLLLNTGFIKSRLNDTDEANESYKNAIALSEKNRYIQLQANLCLEYGYFLGQNGDYLDEGDNLTLSSMYYKKGINLIEKYPFLFFNKINLVKDIYDRNIYSLIKMKQWEQALLETEKKYNLIKIIKIYSLSPDFYNKDDKYFYADYLRNIRELERTTNHISRTLEKGEPQDSPAVKDLEKRLSETMKKSEDLLSSIEKTGSPISSFVAVQKIQIPKLDNTIIYSPAKVDDAIYLFEVENGKIGMKTIQLNKTDSLQSIIDHIGKNKKNKFVVLNETSLDIFINKKKELKNIPGFMFIPSIMNSAAYIKSDNHLLNKVFFTGSGLNKSVTLPGIQIDEGTSINSDIAGYSIIIDGINRNTIEPKYLLNNMLRSTLIIKNRDEIDVEYILLFAETARYSGVKTVVYTQKAGLDTVKSLLSSVGVKNFSDFNYGDKNLSNLMALGYGGISGKDQALNTVKIKENEFQQYKSSLANRDFDRAMIHLKRWNSLTDGNENKIIYYTELSEIEALKENYSQAKLSLDNALKVSKPNSDLFDVITLKIIYLNYLSGDINNADSLLKKADAGRLQNYYDYHIFKALEILLAKGIRDSRDYYNQAAIKKYKNTLAINRTNLLYAEYIKLFDNDEMIKNLLKNWQPDYLLSVREMIKAYYLTGVTGKEKDIPLTLQNLKNLFKIKSSDNFIKGFLSQMENESEINSAYPIFIQMSIEYLINNNASNKIKSLLENFSFDDLARKYNWLDTTMVLKKGAAFYSLEGARENSLTLYQQLLKNMEMKNAPQIRKKIIFDNSLVLAETEKYGDSYNLALKGEPLLTKNDDDYISYQLHLLDCETVMNMNEKGDKRAKEISSIKDSSISETFILNLLKSRIELNRLAMLKEATVNDAKNFDQLFINSINILDKYPGIMKNFRNLTLMNQIFDSFINYKMKTGNPTDSLIFAEIKKLLNLRAKFPSLQDPKLPGNIIEKAGTGDSKNLIQLLNTHPEIQMAKIIKDFPLSSFQNKIKDNAVLFYTAKVGNDIFIWVLGNNFKDRIILEKGFPKLKLILAIYSDLLSKFNNTLQVSRDLETFFAPIKKYYEKKEVIIFVTDNDMEPVPFEIMGSKNMLIETNTIVYLSSLISGLKDLKAVLPRVSMLGTDEKIFNQLEKVSLSESGISYSQVSTVDSGIGHIHMTVSYNNIEKDLFFENNKYNNLIKNPGYIYMPSVDFSGISQNDFSIYNSTKGISGVIINDSAVHDLNNAYFIDVFYKEIVKNNNIISSFVKAKSAIKSKNEFKHPAYWAGIRLYLNGI